MTLIEFICQGHRYALPLACVRRIVVSAKPEPLPGAPDIVLGILNVANDVVTVINFSQRIGLPAVDIRIDQRILIVDIPGLIVGFIVDDVLGVSYRELRGAKHAAGKFPRAEFVTSVIRKDDGLCIIIDPEKFLFDEEHALLASAFAEGGDERN